MTDVPTVPPNKRVSDLTTEITLDLHEKFKNEKDFKKRDTEMIDYLIKKLAYHKALIEVTQKMINGIPE